MGFKIMVHWDYGRITRIYKVIIWYPNSMHDKLVFLGNKKEVNKNK